jgi:hypothetical protein
MWCKNRSEIFVAGSIVELVALILQDVGVRENRSGAFRLDVIAERNSIQEQASR